MEFFVTTTLMGAHRFSPRFAHSWFLQQRRSRSAPRVRALIVGAGSAGELLLRDLYRSDEHDYDIVGLVDDDPAKQGISLGGRPVLGTLDSVPEVARRRDVRELLFAIPRLPAARLREVLGACADLKLNYKILPVSFAYLNDRVSSSMLQSLSPDDLLPRHQTHFDEEKMRALIAGRRILVTGAGGSIGSEICRQAAAHAPASLVLADMNENELYLLYRQLKHRYPGVSIAAEVVDIRDAARLRQLAERYAPQDVFHAAAHKHVPLMEDAPEEAVKNNVVACRNVALVADAVGAERFVLISTDKAVNPSSVMGATKRISELIIRDIAQRSRVTFTTVRFGNVLGSAGSVVPLFKAQIAERQALTVTHPDVRRYLMTIREAVGLVILAGLGGYGDLCILEMGEPIRILDLARLMITLSGLVPEEDIPIVFTGLRPGEKLEEELMTEEERNNTHQFRDSIRIIQTPPPAAELIASIALLESLALRGNRHGVVAWLRSFIPTYAPAGPWAEGTDPALVLPALSRGAGDEEAFGLVRKAPNVH